jgi:hypothetical protein
MEEFQKSKGDRALDFALPALAVLEAIMTGKASKGNYIGHAGLDIMNARNQRQDSEAARREKAVERAARAEEATFNRNMKIADGVRDSKRAGMEESRYFANEDETHRKIVDRDKAITRMLGIPTETDEATNTVSMGKPSLPDLTPIDREAIQQDPLGWISNRLKPAPTQLVLGGDGTYQPVNKLTGKNPDGKTVTAPPPKESKSLEQIAAEAAARAKGAAEGGGPKAEKPPTEDMTKAATFARRMELAMSDLSELEKAGYDRASNAAAAENSFLTPNAMVSKEGQRYTNAEKNFASANLRKESGAVIGRDEMLAQEALYFPRHGDSPETKAQKARNRAQAYEGMKSAAGTQFAKVPSMVPVQAGGTVWRKGTDGKEYEYDAATKQPTGKVR